jgi:hypothetical protein
MTYLLFICALALAGIAGLQFAYLAFLEANNRQLKQRIVELERIISRLHLRQSRPASDGLPEDKTDEPWPDYLDHEK